MKRQAEQEIEAEFVNNWVDEEGALPKHENFENFNITEHSLVFAFDPYKVGPYAWGTRLVEIPYSEVRSYLNIEGLLKHFLE